MVNMTSDQEMLTYKNAGNFSLLNLLPSLPGRLLDCGCGAGDNARILKGRGWQVTAVTLDYREKEAAGAFCDAVYLADLEVGLPVELSGTFDVVLASHILEHLANPDRFLHQVHQRLSPSGILAVALPNIAHYRQRFSLLQGRFQYTETGPLDRTHLRFYTYWTAIELLRENGYSLTMAQTEGSLPWWKARLFVPERLMRYIDGVFVPRLPNLLGHQSLLIAQPKRAAI
jgi:SAM-dependent methyltransferase